MNILKYMKYFQLILLFSLLQLNLYLLHRIFKIFVSDGLLFTTTNAFSNHSFMKKNKFDLVTSKIFQDKDNQLF